MKDAAGPTDVPRLLSRSPKFLVIRSGAIGDTLMATPLLRSLRVSFPDAYIGAVTSRTAIDVLRFNPHVDEVFALERRHLPYFFSLEKRRLAGHFRRLGLDTVLSLESSSSFTDLACRLNAGRIFTYDQSPLCENTERLLPEAGEHSIETHLRAGAAAGAAPAGTAMELHFPPAVSDAVEVELAALSITRDEPIIGIHAGWGSRLQDPDDTRLRSWPADRFAELIQRLSARFHARVVLTGTSLDQQLNDTIISRSGAAAVNAAGKFSLLETAALIKRLNAYVTIDSGPAHIAAAVGTPLVTLWGPGIFDATRPVAGTGLVELLYLPPPCAPCYGAPHMKTCTNNICMRSISVDAAESAVSAVLI